VIVTLEDAKTYLRVDSSCYDSILEIFINSAEHLCTDILRENLTTDERFRTAVLYAVGYFYEHMEKADNHELILSLRSMLWSKEAT